MRPHTERSFWGVSHLSRWCLGRVLRDCCTVPTRKLSTVASKAPEAKVFGVVKSKAVRWRRDERLTLKCRGFVVLTPRLWRPFSWEELRRQEYDCGKVAVDQTQQSRYRLTDSERAAFCTHHGLWRRGLSRVRIKASTCLSTLLAILCSQLLRSATLFPETVC